jgi:drug/metabolite transporter (DMT)-like permease
VNQNAPKDLKVLFQLHIAALLLGGTAQFSKLIDLNAVDIITYRTLVCGLIVGAIAVATNKRLAPATLRDGILLVFCSALFCVHWTAYFHAMQLSSVAVGIVSMFSFPVLTVLLEPLFSDKKLEAFDVLMGLLVMAGVYLIVPEFTLQNNITIGVAFGLLSAVAVALRNVLVARYLRAYSAFSVMTYHGLISCIILIAFTSVSITDIKLQEWVLLVLLGSLFTAIPHTQITLGLMKTSAKTTSMIVSLQVVYAVIIAYFLLGEAASTTTLLGGACILIAAISESLKHHKSSP